MAGRRAAREPAPRGGGPVIEVRGLTKRYGSTVAVDRLSFDVPAGCRDRLSSWERPIRIEPMTYALREACSQASPALPAPMPREGAVTASKTPEFPGHLFHDSFCASKGSIPWRPAKGDLHFVRIAGLPYSAGCSWRYGVLSARPVAPYGAKSGSRCTGRRLWTRPVRPPRGTSARTGPHVAGHLAQP
jgi:hypothetical protein